MARKPLSLKAKIAAAVGIIVLALILIGVAGGKSTPKTASASSATSDTTTPSVTATATTAPATTTTTTPAPTTTTLPARVVSGKAVTLGAGNFSSPADVAPGLYNVTAASGQSGNFIVSGRPSYDEILGGSLGVPSVRAQISAGDRIELSGLSAVSFAPVTSPLVTSHTLVTLGAGTWTVGQDIGAGRYVATPGAGQSGNFIVDAEFVDEILGGSYGVPSVTVTLHKGDVIDISGLASVTMTPTGP